LQQRRALPALDLVVSDKMGMIHLEAGLPMLIELSEHTSFDTHIIGFETGNFIIVKLINNRSDFEISVKTPCSARLIHEGVIYTFSTEVLALMNFPAQLIFLKYPLKIDVVQLRKDRRYKVNVPAVFHNNTQNFLVKVSTVKDISMQGCHISIPEKSKHPAIRIADSCKVSFIVMHKYFEASCIVKNIYEGEDTTYIGTEFVEIKDICKELLNGLINILELKGEADSEPETG
jgi:c-di-GMP-binding flagellar brake protein YcgR